MLQNICEVRKADLERISEQWYGPQDIDEQSPDEDEWHAMNISISTPAQQR
jgi:hypothetical protein